MCHIDRYEEIFNLNAYNISEYSLFKRTSRSHYVNNKGDKIVAGGCHDKEDRKTNITLEKNGVIKFLGNEIDNLAKMEGVKNLKILQEMCGIRKLALWDLLDYLKDIIDLYKCPHCKSPYPQGMPPALKTSSGTEVIRCIQCNELYEGRRH